MTFRFLNNTKENVEWLNKIAATYNHNPSWEWPILIAENEGEFIAYIEIINCPLLNFAINPSTSNPRLTDELVQNVKSWSLIQNGNCIACRPQDPETKFTDEIMEKLGFQNQKLELFSAKE